MTKRMWSIVLLAIIFVTGVRVANSAWTRNDSGLTARPSKLGNVQEFKAAFQNDEGKIRLVALVSPT